VRGLCAPIVRALSARLARGRGARLIAAKAIRLALGLVGRRQAALRPHADALLGVDEAERERVAAGEPLAFAVRRATARLTAVAVVERKAVVERELQRIESIEDRRAALAAHETVEELAVDPALGARDDPGAHLRTPVLARRVRIEHIVHKRAMEAEEHRLRARRLGD